MLTYQKNSQWAYQWKMKFKFDPNEQRKLFSRKSDSANNDNFYSDSTIQNMCSNKWCDTRYV